MKRVIQRLRSSGPIVQALTVGIGGYVGGMFAYALMNAITGRSTNVFLGPIGAAVGLFVGIYIFRWQEQRKAANEKSTGRPDN